MKKSDWQLGFDAGVAAMREHAARCCDSHAQGYTGNCKTEPRGAAINCATLIRDYLKSPAIEMHGGINAA